MLQEKRKPTEWELASGDYLSLNRTVSSDIGESGPISVPQEQNWTSSSTFHWLLGIAAGQHQAVVSFCYEYNTKKLDMDAIFCVLLGLFWAMVLVASATLVHQQSRSVVLSALTLFRRKENPHWAALIASVIFANAAMVCSAWALSMTDTGDFLSLLSAGKLILSGAMASLLFSDHLSASVVAQWICCIVGALLIVRPGFVFGYNGSHHLSAWSVILTLVCLTPCMLAYIIIDTAIVLFAMYSPD